MRHVPCLFLVLLFGCDNADDAKRAPIRPDEASKKVGETVTVEMEVRSVGRGKSGVFFLNSEPNYRSAENFTLFIDRSGAANFKKAGISDPAEHFKRKKVTATGKVRLYKNRPEIILEEPKQIELVKKK